MGLLTSMGIMQRVLVIVCLIFFGIAARKFGIIKDEARESLANIMINITLPPLIFFSLISEIQWQRLVTGFTAPIISLGLIIGAMLIIGSVQRLVRASSGRNGTFLILSTMPNTAFIGFPLILTVFGKEGLAFAVLYDIGVTMAFCSVAIIVLKGGIVSGEVWKELVNPPLIAVVIGLLFNKLGLQLPDLVLEPLKIMGNATVPLAMLLMGYMIGGAKFRLETLHLELGLVCIIKLLIYPMLAYLFIIPFKLDPMVRAVILIEAAMPSMASTPVLVQKYGGDEEFAVSGTFLTTILSIVTIPLMVHFLL